VTYRILSLDGGGAWALIEVQALLALYSADTKGRQILADFNLVAANSGGSLVLGGLVENLSLGDLLDYFFDESKRRAIFSPTHSWGDKALYEITGLGPKYSAEAKLPALERLLPQTGDRRLTDVARRIRRPGGDDDLHVLIVGFDYDRNRATFFRSAPAGSTPGWGTGAAATVTLAQAIHASTNAPVNYFDGPAEFPDRPERYWDGGITGCNNPVLAAVTEAVVLGNKPTDIVALSLGTASVVLPLMRPGDTPSPYLVPRSDTGLVHDLRKLATAILDDPPDAATFNAHVLCGGRGSLPSSVPPSVESRIVRLNPLISPVKDSATNQWTAPKGLTVAQFKYLCGLDMDAVEQGQVAAIAQYAGLWLANKAPNQPIRIDGDTLKPEIGYGFCGDALAAWSVLKAI